MLKKISLNATSPVQCFTSGKSEFSEKKNLSLHIPINSSWHEEGHLNLLKILCISLKKFWDFIRGFMSNHCQMQVKGIIGLPLTVRGCPSLCFCPQSFHLHPPSSILASSIPLKSWLPCCQYYVRVKLIEQSLVKNKQNNILKISFWVCIPVLGQITFFFFVLHFPVCKMECVILALVWNGLVSPSANWTFLA